MKILRVIRHPSLFLLKLNNLGIIKLSDKKFLKAKYLKVFNKKLNLKNPQTFNEKIQWLKLHNRQPIYTELVDKSLVKKHVSDIIGEKYIIPTLGVYNTFDEIDFDKLPNQFVIKCTHDSGGLIICKDKSKFDYENAKKKIEKSLSRNYYYNSREWPYKNVKPRIIVEKYMEDKEKIVPEDYKLYCFNGEPKYIVVFHNRFDNSKKLSETVYDTDWNPQHVSFDNHFEISDIIEEKPKCLDELLEITRKLCANLPQVRIDFYIINNKIYFGEITFYTASGFQPMIPESLDEKLGKLIDLSGVKSNEK